MFRVNHHVLNKMGSKFKKKQCLKTRYCLVRPVSKTYKKFVKAQRRMMWVYFQMQFNHFNKLFVLLIQKNNIITITLNANFPYIRKVTKVFFVQFSNDIFPHRKGLSALVPSRLTYIFVAMTTGWRRSLTPSSRLPSK